MTIDLQRLVAVLLIAVVLLVCAWVVADVVLTWRIEVALANLERAGYATSLPKLAPSAVPEAENAATLYEAAYAKVKPRPNLDNEIIALRKKGLDGLSAEEREDIEAWLRDNEPFFSAVRDARARPRCRFDHDYAGGLDATLPARGSIVGMARMLKGRAHWEAANGRTADAREWMKDVLRLADAMRDEPMIVSQLVRNVCTSMALKAVDEMVTKDSTDAELAAWRECLPAADAFDDMTERGWRGELAALAAMPRMRATVEKFSGNIPPKSKIHPVLYVFLEKAWRADAPNYFAFMRNAIEATRRPPHEALKALEKLDEGASSVNKLLHPMIGVMKPAVVPSYRNFMQLKAKLVVVRAGIEAERTRLAGGRYPDAIDAIDPFAGKALTYKPDEGLFYSFGYDGDDDGGRAVTVDRETGEQDGDIVWTMRRAP